MAAAFPFRRRAKTTTGYKSTTESRKAELKRASDWYDEFAAAPIVKPPLPKGAPVRASAGARALASEIKKGHYKP